MGGVNTRGNLVLGTQTELIGDENPFNQVIIRPGKNGILLGGVTTVSDEFYVDWAATFRGDIYARNDIVLSGDISVQKGSKFIYRGTNNINIIGTTTMQTENNQGETVTDIKELVVGSSHLTKPIELRTSGGVSIPNCGLSVSGATTLSGALTVSGATTLSGGVSGNISLNKDGKIGWIYTHTVDGQTVNDWWNFIGGKTTNNVYDYISVGGSKVATDIIIQNTGSSNNIRLSPGGKAYYGSASANNEIAKKGDIPTNTSQLTNNSGFLTSSSLANYVTNSSLSTTLSSYFQNSSGTLTGNSGSFSINAGGTQIQMGNNHIYIGNRDGAIYLRAATVGSIQIHNGSENVSLAEYIRSVVRAM